MSFPNTSFRTQIDGQWIQLPVEDPSARITAVHYNTGLLYIMRFLPHAEYSRGLVEGRPMNSTTKGRIGDGLRYMELVEQFPLRPIKSKTDYHRAVAILDPMMSHEEGSLSVDEQDYMETLALLVEQYDIRHAPAGSSTDVEPVEMLKHLMEENDMNTSDLGRLLGSKGLRQRY